MTPQIEHERPSRRNPAPPFAQQPAPETLQPDQDTAVRKLLDRPERGARRDPADLVRGRVTDRQQAEPVRPSGGEGARDADPIAPAAAFEDGALRGREIEAVEQGGGGRRAGGEQTEGDRRSGGPRPDRCGQWQ